MDKEKINQTFSLPTDLVEKTLLREAYLEANEDGGQLEALEDRNSMLPET